MNNLKIIFINNLNDEKTVINITDNIIIYIFVINLSTYELVKELVKIQELLKIYDKIKKIKIFFDNTLTLFLINKIITKLSNILYSYKSNNTIKLYRYSLENRNIINIDKSSNKLMNELSLYKHIVMDPNKNPETYLDYIKSRVPENYNINIYNLNEFNKFPLTKAVGAGSQYNSYFVHVYPKYETENTIFLVGKSVTYDSGGMNIKTKHMEEMKTDMAGSALAMSVLNLLAHSHNNIHLLIPIVENMIGNTAIRPGQVVKSYNSKLVEIVDTDAEGRLCLADCLAYINKDLLVGKNPNNCLIIDVATLTGSAVAITSEVASISMCNSIGEKYKNRLMQVAERVGEYLEYLQLRPEYLDFLKSPVADIKNLNYDVKAGCIIGGTFLNYFISDECPWIHLDIAPSAYIKEMSMSYGINLLVEYIKIHSILKIEELKV